MQRRDNYRLLIPVTLPANCFIPTPNGGEAAIALTDISIGGIGLLGFNPDIELIEGETLYGCRVELPSMGIIHCDLVVRTQSDITLKNGIKTIRTGCQFAHLNAQNETLLQRYLFQLEQRSK